MVAPVAVGKRVIAPSPNIIEEQIKVNLSKLQVGRTGIDLWLCDINLHHWRDRIDGPADNNLRTYPEIRIHHKIQRNIISRHLTGLDRQPVPIRLHIVPGAYVELKEDGELHVFYEGYCTLTSWAFSPFEATVLTHQGRSDPGREPIYISGNIT